MKLYLISGLGADERVFQRLDFPDNITIHHIKWSEISDHETLHSYRDKILTQIDTSKEFGLIGLSFGGIMVTEITKIVRPKISLIISSVSNSSEMPLIYRLIVRFRINRLVPNFLLDKAYPFTPWFFGVNNSEDKKLLKSIIHSTPPHFTKWAVNEIVNWKNKKRLENIFHIHGSEDRIFPIQNTKADKIIENAGHLMVHTHAGLVSQTIKEYLGHR